MFIELVFAVAAVQTPSATRSSAAAPRDPRIHPLTVDDALYSIPDVTGRIERASDMDADGVEDLYVVRGGDRSDPKRIDAISSRSGACFRTVWLLPEPEPGMWVWDASGDANGDGVHDLLIGLPSDSAIARCAGRALVVSGSDGSTLREWRGEREHDRLGAAVTFVGDIDGDGRDDFAIGTPQYDAYDSQDTQEILSSYNDFPKDPRKGFLHLVDDRRVNARQYWQDRLAHRSSSPGFVTIRSGATGDELRRFVGGPTGHAFGFMLAAMREAMSRSSADLLVQCDVRSDEPVRVYSLGTGDIVSRFPHRLGPVGCAGDLDADGMLDVFLDELNWQWLDRRQERVTFASIGSPSVPSFELHYPDVWSKWGVTIPVGDIDGDGCDDIALGEPNFNLTGRDRKPASNERDLRQLPLKDALLLDSNPQCAGTWESGCALVYSSRTREVVFGVWGLPGSRDGMGLDIATLPDITGDGRPEIAVSDWPHAWIFAGPGRAPNAK